MVFEPFTPQISIPRDRSMADWYQERIEKQIEDFQDELGDDEQAEVVVVLRDGRRIVPTWFGYHNPNMLVVDGVDEQGREVRLLSPHLDTHVILTKVKNVSHKARDIGFQPRSRPTDEVGMDADGPAEN